jgi:hypothetical protein
MKNHFTSLIAILIAIVLISCNKYDTGTNSGPEDYTLKDKSKGGNIMAKRDAHPAWAFGMEWIDNNYVYHYSIAVSDVDGSDRADVYTPSTGRTIGAARWSQNGTSVSFYECPPLTSNTGSWYTRFVWGNYAIKAVDVSVVRGVAVGSNVRTVFSSTTSDSMRIVSQAWSPATSGLGANKIAFMVYTPTQSKIYLVSTSGGTATQIYAVNNTSNRLNAGTITWKSDGSRLAFSQYSGTSTGEADVTYSIKIIDLSGTVQTTLIDGSYPIGGCQWSNAGTDRIAFYKSSVINPSVAADWNVYTIGTSSGSTPSSVVSGIYSTPFWSPDNSELVYFKPSLGSYRINLFTFATTLVIQSNHYGDWK